MSDQSLKKSKWIMLLRKTDVVKTDDRTEFHEIVQSYNKSLVSEQEFKKYRKIIEDSLKKYNNKQDIKDQKINNYSCYFWDLANEKSSVEMTIVLDNEIDWKDATDEEIARGTKVINNFVKFFDQTNKNIHVGRLKDHDDESSPHAQIEFRPEDTDDEKLRDKLINWGIDMVIGNKKNRNREKLKEQPDSEDSPESAKKEESKITGMGLKPQSNERKREKEKKERERIEKLKKKRIERKREEKKREKEREKERERIESKKKSNAEKQQDDGLEP